MSSIFRLCAIAGIVFLLRHPTAAQSEQPDTSRLKRGYTLFKPVPKELLRDFTPDRPGITMSAHTVDAGHFQLEMDAARYRDERDPDERQRTLHFVDALLKLGLTRTTDVQLGVQSFLRERSTYRGQTSLSRGFGDVTLRLKQNFFGNDPTDQSVLAVSAYVRAPTGGQQGAGGWEAGVAIPFEYDFSDAFDVEAQIEGELRYDRERAEPEPQLNSSFLLDYRFGPGHRLEAFAEGAGTWNARQHNWRANVNIGPGFYLTSELRLDAGIHLPLTQSPYNRELFAGLSLRI